MQITRNKKLFSTGYFKVELKVSFLDFLKVIKLQKTQEGKKVVK